LPPGLLRSPKEPVVGRVGHALHTHAGDGAGLGVAAGRDDAVDRSQALGLSGFVVVELQPRHRTSADDALVGLGRGRDIADLLHNRLEPRRAEVEHGDAVDVEVVVPEELDDGPALEPEVCGGREGLRRVGAVLGSGQLVERQRRVPEQIFWRVVPD